VSIKVEAEATRNPHEGGGVLLEYKWKLESETGDHTYHTKVLAFRTIDHARNHIGDLARLARPKMQRVRLTQVDEHTWKYSWRADVSTFRP